VNVGGKTSGLALSTGVLGTSGAVLVRDTMNLDNDDDDDNDHYDNNASSAGNSDKDLESAGAPPDEDVDACMARLLRSVKQQTRIIA
jgi:hypothetical protein